MTERRRDHRPDSGPSGPLAVRLADHLRDLGVQGELRLVLALSGGLDSLVLLHLLRFGGVLPQAQVVGAHMDHRMRPGSHADARWVRGLARAWEVPLELGTADSPPADEAEARKIRYRFLSRVMEGVSAQWVLTAHHRDDQAETVLHRVLRGTGPAGLRGIQAKAPLPFDGTPSHPRSRGATGARPHHLLRPLLPFGRDELEAYADAAGLRPREDPTNLDTTYGRNVIRRELLPRVREAVAPGAREALVRLAEVATEDEAAWDVLLARLEESLILESSSNAVWIHRGRFLEEPRAVQRRLLRRWMVVHHDVHPSWGGTEDAQRFSGSAPSGGRMDLPGGLELRRDFGRLRLGQREPSEGPVDPTSSEPILSVPGPGEGGGTLTVGGRRFRVRWSGQGSHGAEAGNEGAPWSLRLPSSGLRFPLRFRAWRAGDRVRVPGGRKKLSKAFGERRVPRPERARIPVLVEADEAVLWVPGVVQGRVPEADGDPEMGGLHVTVSPEGEESA